MKIMKYPVKEVNIKEIPNNRMLGIGISKNQKALCRKTIESYGLLMPIVAVEKKDGPLVVLRGDNELAVLKDMSVERADVFVATMKSDNDVGKMILLLSSIQKEMNQVSEGLILKEIIDTGKYNQKHLAIQLAKSESWISKRLSLAERLGESVTAMVLNRELSCSVAQNVARIPKSRQLEFAMNIRSENMAKSNVEKLVGAYATKNASDSFRETIISNPSLALELIGERAAEKIPGKSDGTARFESTLRLLLKLITELEVYFAQAERDQILRYTGLIRNVKTSAEGLLGLIGSISPGKSEKQPEERIASGHGEN